MSKRYTAIGTLYGATAQAGVAGPYVLSLLEIDERLRLRVIAFDSLAGHAAFSNRRTMVVAELEENPGKPRLVLKAMRLWEPGDGTASLVELHANAVSTARKSPSATPFRLVSDIATEVGHEQVHIAATTAGAVVARISEVDGTISLLVDLHPTNGDVPRALMRDSIQLDLYNIRGPEQYRAATKDAFASLLTQAGTTVTDRDGYLRRAA